MIKFFKKITKRKILTFLVVVLYWAAIKVTMHLNNIDSVKLLLVNVVELEKVCYVIQIITGLCVILSATIAVWQYYLSTKCEINRQDMECVQRSIELAEYYRKNVLDNYDKIKYIFQETKMYDIVKTIKPENMKEFDEQELIKNLSGAQLEVVKKINQSKDFVNAIIKMDVALDLDLGTKNYIKVELDKKEVSMNGPAIKRKYGRLLAETLNCLEYFAMNFEHNTADESVVYQSLHQTYIDLVQTLYCEISRTNSTGHRKYYTNVISLYNRWYARQEQHKEEQNKKTRSLVTKGTVVAKLS